MGTRDSAGGTAGAELRAGAAQVGREAVGPFNISPGAGRRRLVVAWICYFYKDSMVREAGIQVRSSNTSLPPI